jgi:hypothetical protein
MTIKANIETDCTIDKLLTFDSDDKYPAEPAQTLGLSDLTLGFSEENQKVHSYKFAVSANDNKDVSKLANA